MERRKEWLTDEIAQDYKAKTVVLSQNGRQDVREVRKLRMELMDRCGVTEVEAFNILNETVLKHIVVEDMPIKKTMDIK